MLGYRLLSVAALVALGLVPWATVESRGQTAAACATDLHGDPLPAGALARAGTIRWRQGTVVAFAAFLPDGKNVLSVSDDRVITVWEFPSGKEQRHLDPPHALPGTAVLRLRGRNSTAAAISQDGKTLACNFNGENLVFLYDIATGKNVSSVQIGNNVRGPSLITAIDFSPDGKHLAVLISNGTVQLQDWAKNQEIRQFGTEPGRLPVALNSNGVLTYAPNGKLLASSFVDLEDNVLKSSIKLWDPATGKEVHSLPLARAGRLFNSAVFSPDSSMLAFVDTDGATKLVDTAAGRVVKTMQSGKMLLARQGSGSSLVFAPDGKSLFQRDVNSEILREWNVATGAEVRQLTAGPTERRAINTVVGDNFVLNMAPNGKTLIIAGYDQMIHFIDVPSGKDLHPTAVDGHLASVDFVQFSPDGQHLWTHQAGDPAISEWDAANGKGLGSMKATMGVGKPTVSANSRFVATLNPGQAGTRVLDTVTGEFLCSIPPKQGGERRDMAVSPDGKVLALRSRVGQNIELYDTRTGKLQHTFAIVTGDPARGAIIDAPILIAAPTMLFAPDSRTLLAYSEPDKLACWDVATGKKLKTVALPERLRGGLSPITFSPDGRCLVFDLRDGTVVECELASGAERRVFGKASPQPRVATVVRLVRTVGTFDAGKVAFSPDGTRLAHAGTDRVVRVYDVTTGNELASFRGHIGDITAVAFAPDSKRLASASTDTTALIWDVSVVTAKPLPARSLTAAELEARWTALLDANAAKAFDALCELAATPKETIALLKNRVRPAPALDAELLQKMLAQLDSENFKERQQASAELLKMGERVVPALEKALASQPSLELKRRLEYLLDRLAGPKLTGEQVRTVRAVEVLERIGTREAGQVLESLAEGAPGALQTTASQAALERMAMRH
jgi:WD40 repeat protein